MRHGRQGWRKASAADGKATVARGLVMLCALSVVVAAAQAQTFSVLHTFGNGTLGQYPEAGVVKDRSGNLYGTTTAGGIQFGTVYELSRRGSGWTANPLYIFQGNSSLDGAIPYSRVIFGANGSLYGTTYHGGGNQSGHCLNGCGIIYNLQPSLTACRTVLCPWNETVLYRFQGGTDGDSPGFGDITFDSAGNIYGTTTRGGAFGQGTVYKLTRTQSDWTESILYSFGGGSDGSQPWSGVTFDAAGNLYGTTYEGGGMGCGGTGCGTVYRLTPAGSGWTESVLHSFQGSNDGSYVYAGLVADQAGNLYGATSYGGSGNGGTIFELTPSGSAWTFNLLYSFIGNYGPYNDLVLDAAGNLYGTEPWPADWVGKAFKLSPGANGWTFTSLHGFSGSGDGEFPEGTLLLDPDGTIYGTASQDGGDGWGTVWEITP